jgi:hypothetical protein
VCSRRLLSNGGYNATISAKMGINTQPSMCHHTAVKAYFHTTNCGVPHISPGFGEMWELTDAGTRVPIAPENFRFQSSRFPLFVVMNISQKSSASGSFSRC